MNAQDVFDMLSAPFPTEAISWRVGSTNGEKSKGMALAYIDARDVMDRFDSVVGPANWQSEFVNAGNGATCCRIGIRVGTDWVWKADGAGQTDYEGEKGQFSDALKRAAVSWGVGRYLYDLDSPWVQIEQKGKTFIIKDGEKAKLDEVHDKAATRIGWGGKHARTVATCMRIVDAIIRDFVIDPVSAVDFEMRNEAHFKALPKDARNHIKETLSRVGASISEAA